MSDGLSNLTVGGRRLTWREASQYFQQMYSNSERLVAILFDLDRCEHGRHEGDVCSGSTGCNGPSHGNPLLTDRRLGFDISGRPLSVPRRGADVRDPEAWGAR